MRNTKRLLSLVLTFAMVLSMSTMALAADINTGVDDNTADFTGGGGGGVTNMIVQFETDAKNGTLDGKDKIYVAPGSRVPQNRVPNVIPNLGANFKGWLVKGEEENGLVDLDEFRVNESVVLVAAYDVTNVPTPVPSGKDLLNKADHFAYMKGDEAGTFRPDAPMTRAEAATVFYNLLLDQDVALTKSFSDVNDQWFAVPVRTLASLGIINGYEDGTFKPNKTITRAEFAAIASKFDDLSGGTATFNDVKGHWAEPFIVSAATKGWVGGYPDGSFKPNDNINRASVAVITNNVLNRIADKNFVDSENVREFTDLSTSHWAYYGIMEAVNTHDYTRNENGVEAWTALK